MDENKNEGKLLIGTVCVDQKGDITFAGDLIERTVNSAGPNIGVEMIWLGSEGWKLAHNVELEYCEIFVVTKTIAVD